MEDHASTPQLEVPSVTPKPAQRPPKKDKDSTRNSSNQRARNRPVDPNSDKPREERPYIDYFPTLSCYLPLKIKKLSGSGQLLRAETATPEVDTMSDVVTEAESILASPDIPPSQLPTEHASMLMKRLVNKKAHVPSFLHAAVEESVRGDVPKPSDVDSLPPIIDEDVKSKLHQLPKPSFRHVEKIKAPKKDWHRPQEYITHTDANEEELFRRCEYDMDDQDRCWLEGINNARSREPKKPISTEFFEEALDKLEKEWFNLVKDVPIPKEDIPNGEDIACSVCNDTECENTNAIVFCDGCNLAVHQECYGIPFIPEGQWLCRKCMVSPEAPVSCIFCPNEGGAFKQTSNNKWGHVVCGLWIPELFFSNPVYLEPIDQVDKIPKTRWNLLCYICQRPQGACIQCDHKQCYQAFHVTCAQRAKLHMEMTLGEDKLLRAFCDRHTPSGTVEVDEIREATKQFRIQVLKESRRKQPSRVRTPNQSPVRGDFHSPRRQDGRGTPNTKAAAAHQKNYDVSSNVAPEYVYQKVVEDLMHFGYPDTEHIVRSLTKYWSLKRASRRGAALLKRLHLEPWTASASANHEDEKVRHQRFQSYCLIRKDLEKVRMLVDHCQRREKQKLKLYNIIADYVETMTMPLAQLIRPIWEELVELDTQEVFLNPVDTTIVPDYLTVIKTPMDLTTIGNKINDYTNFADFENDVVTMVQNCLLYNKRDSNVHRQGQKFDRRLPELFNQAREDATKIRLIPGTTTRDLPFLPGFFSLLPEDVPLTADGWIPPEPTVERMEVDTPLESPIPQVAKAVSPKPVEKPISPKPVEKPTSPKPVEKPTSPKPTSRKASAQSSRAATPKPASQKASARNSRAASPKLVKPADVSKEPEGVISPQDVAERIQLVKGRVRVPKLKKGEVFVEEDVVVETKAFNIEPLPDVPGGRRLRTGAIVSSERENFPKIGKKSRKSKESGTPVEATPIEATPIEATPVEAPLAEAPLVETIASNAEPELEQGKLPVKKGRSRKPPIETPPVEATPVETSLVETNSITAETEVEQKVPVKKGRPRKTKEVETPVENKTKEETPVTSPRKRSQLPEESETPVKRVKLERNAKGKEEVQKPTPKPPTPKSKQVKETPVSPSEKIVQKASTKHGSKKDTPSPGKLGFDYPQDIPQIDLDDNYHWLRIIGKHVTPRPILITFHQEMRRKNKGPKKERFDAWRDYKRDNDAFRRYYLDQNVISQEELEEWIATLVKPLPTTFRITGSKNSAENMRDAIARDYLPALEALQLNEAMNPPRTIKFYPHQLAYSCEIPRTVLRKSMQAAGFHQFLITETEAGNISRQEAVSMVPPLLLNVLPHHLVLDLCAAPGSKTGQLIEALHAGDATGMVVANDADFKRSLIMVKQTKRFDSPNVVVTNQDASAFPAIHFDGKLLEFDRVLCDVPCSGDGTLRKNPTLWTRWHLNIGHGLHDLQVRILRRGFQLTKVGGKIVYSTCSFNPIENEAVVASLMDYYGDAVELVDVSHELPELKRRPGLTTWKVFDKNGKEYKSFDEVPGEHRKSIRETMFPPTQDIGLSKCVRLMPQDQDTGGFFVAVFNKVKFAGNRRPRKTKKAQEEDEPEVEEVVEQEDDAKLGDKRANNEQQPSQNKKQKTESRDDQYIFVPTDNALMKSIVENFTKDDFPADQLLVRSELEKFKNIYFVGASVKKFLQSPDLKKIRVVHAGVKVFSRKDAIKDAAIPYRIMTDGIDSISRWLADKQVVDISTKEFKIVLEKRTPLFTEMEEETQKRLAEAEEGNFVVRVHCDPKDPLLKISQPEVLYLPAWRAKVSLNLLRNEAEKGSLKWRLFGELNQAAIDKAKEMREQRQTKSNASQTPKADNLEENGEENLEENGEDLENGDIPEDAENVEPVEESTENAEPNN